MLGNNNFQLSRCGAHYIVTCLETFMKSVIINLITNIEYIMSLEGMAHLNKGKSTIIFYYFRYCRTI